MNRSETISKLAVALVKFNMEVEKITKDRVNPHFKNAYATLDNIIDEVKPLLAKHGVSVLQFPGGDGEKISITTMLLHESGEWIESDPLMLKPVKGDPQAAGSAITYGKRYSLAAILNLNTGDDDDGNAASGQESRQQRSNPAQHNRLQQTMSAPPAFPKPTPQTPSADITKTWNELYKDDPKTLPHLNYWYNKKREEGKSNEEIEYGLANLLAEKTEKEGVTA